MPAKFLEPQAVAVTLMPRREAKEALPFFSSKYFGGVRWASAHWQQNLFRLFNTTTICVLWLSCTINCRAGTTENRTILGLTVEGTQRPLRLETRIGEGLSRERAARDLRRLWATGWFDDIRVEILERDESHALRGDGYSPTLQLPLLGAAAPAFPSSTEEGNLDSSSNPGGVFVVFKFVERPHYLLRHIKFHPASHQYPVAVSSGTMIDKRLAHNVGARLQERLVDEGYRDAQVHTQVVPVNSGQADLGVRVKPGQRYRVSQVRFSGSLGLNEEELQKALSQRTNPGVIPGLEKLWKRWQLPVFSQRSVEEDAEFLRSLYFSRGYWDNIVQLQRVRFDQNEATVTFAVESGLHYAIGSAEISGGKDNIQTILQSNADSPTESLCRCLRNAQKKAEMAGNLDFAVQLEVRSLGPNESVAASSAQIGQTLDHEPQATLRARLEPGPSYKIGRIDFQGNHNFGDLTLRRALLLNEGETFDYGKLRGSLSRLNQMGFFEPLTQDQVRMVRHPARNQVDLTLQVKERPRGRWALAGSAEPLSLLKPLEFSMGSRLPSWCSRTLELSTYFASFSVFPWREPFAPPFLPSGNHWKPVLAVTRPSLPSQEWRSGFAILPQAGWKGTLFNTSLIQAQRVASLLGDDSSTPPRLDVAVRRLNLQDEPSTAVPKFAGSLFCEPPKPRFTWVKSAGLAVLDLALSVPKF